jgi:hypothetical protein
MSRPDPKRERWRRLGAGVALPILALSIATAAACDGSLGDPGDDDAASTASEGVGGGGGVGGGPPSSTPTNFECDPSLVAPQLPLRRLSKTQRENTIRDLARWIVPAEADGVIGEVEATFSQIPDDERVGEDKHYARLTRLDQAVQQEHADAAYAVGRALGVALTTEGRIDAAIGACATNDDAGDDDACLDDFIRRFGERALRRAVTDEDVGFYRAVAGSAPFDRADWIDVVGLMVNAPQALYFVELGDGDGDSVPLTSFELASRLSYHFWQTMPDDELFEVARSGALADDATYQAQVDRIFRDPRTRASLGDFFGEWLENSTLQELDSREGNAVFDAFRGDFDPSPDLREAMLQEVVDAAVWYAYDTEGTWADFLVSKRSFARSDELASIYGVAPWNGEGEPPEVTDPARVGLITRAAYLATGSASTRPIMKGVFLRKALLCDPIGAPPAEVGANPPELSESATTRQVVENLTSVAPCNGCHEYVINPLGFATENFDSLGRVRATQPFFDEETGESLGSAAIDTSGIPRVDDLDDTEITGAADLTGLLVASEKPHACFARQYFRFTFGREEDLATDGCALRPIDQALDEGRPLVEVLRAVALAPAFKNRSFVEAQ